ncbi:hypothetical protein ACHAWF_012291 [Thalassiosira exigua]
MPSNLPQLARTTEYHRVDLETAAALGCSKCLDELETGTKKANKCHDPQCPRSRNYRPAKPSAEFSSIESASVAGKRKRSNDVNDHETEDIDIDGETAGVCENYPKSLDHTPMRIGNTIDFPLSNVRPHLICSLCKGYFRDPHTVADCLHTFCRSCLILFFRQGMRCCPTCNTRLGPDPFHTSISIQSREVIPDRTLQEVVDKIFPWMKEKDNENERVFYAQRGIELKPEYSQEDLDHGGRGSGKVNSSTGVSQISVEGHISLLIYMPQTLRSLSVESSKTMNEMLDLRLEPDVRPPHQHQRLPPLKNSVMRTSGRLKIANLKKYLNQKLGLTDGERSVEILCNGDAMGDDHALTFIFRTRWFSTNQVLTLKYRLEEEEDDK